MHRGPAAYVLGPPPSRSRDLELEGGVIACHVDYVYEPQDSHVRGSGGFRICERVVPTSGAKSAPEKIWVTTPIFAVKPRPFPVF